MKITFPMALFLLFLTLKLCGVIAWSWWWITAPVWAIVPLLIAYGIILAIRDALESPQQRAARLLREMADELSKK